VGEAREKQIGVPFQHLFKAMNPTPLIAVPVLYLILVLPVVELIRHFEHRAKRESGQQA